MGAVVGDVPAQLKMVNGEGHGLLLDREFAARTFVMPQ